MARPRGSCPTAMDRASTPVRASTTRNSSLRSHTTYNQRPSIETAISPGERYVAPALFDAAWRCPRPPNTAIATAATAQAAAIHSTGCTGDEVPDFLRSPASVDMDPFPRNMHQRSFVDLKSTRELTWGRYLSWFEFYAPYAGRREKDSGFYRE